MDSRYTLRGWVYAFLFSIPCWVGMLLLAVVCLWAR